jgi:putative peptidoglycan lipid II flippase
VLATPVTSVLLEHGEFSARGVERTADAIRMLCLALLPGGAVGLLSRAYFALGDFKTPVRVSLVALVLNVVLNFAFVVGLGLDTGGLALATAVVSWVNVALLVPGLSRRLREGAGGEVPGLTDFASRGARMVAGSAACGLVAWGAHRLAAEALGNTLGLFAAIAFGIGTYIIAVQLLGCPEWSAIRDRIAARLRRRS